MEPKLLNRIIDHVEPDDLNYDLRLINESLGMDVVRGLLVNFPSTTFYIPKIQQQIKPLIRSVRDIPELLSMSARELAQTLEVSPSFVYKILHEAHSKQ